MLSTMPSIAASVRGVGNSRPRHAQSMAATIAGKVEREATRRFAGSCFRTYAGEGGRDKREGRISESEVWVVVVCGNVSESSAWIYPGGATRRSSAPGCMRAVGLPAQACLEVGKQAGDEGEGVHRKRPHHLPPPDGGELDEAERVGDGDEGAAAEDLHEQDDVREGEVPDGELVHHQHA